MKTPREILLERHQAAASKLDAIRRESVKQASGLADNTQSETGRMPVLLLLWRKLIWPSRRVWAGLAAAWVLIVAVNFSMRDRSPASTMAAAPAPQMMLTFREQQKLLNELIGPDKPRATEAATPFVPQPSSERRLEILMT